MIDVDDVDYDDDNGDVCDEKGGCDVQCDDRLTGCNLHTANSTFPNPSQAQPKEKGL